MFGLNLAKIFLILQKNLHFTRFGWHMLSIKDIQESPLGIAVVFASIPWGFYRNAHSYSCLISYFPPRFNFTYVYENFFFLSCHLSFSHSSLFP